VTGLFTAAPVLAILLGAVAGGGLLLLVTALRGMPLRRQAGQATALEGRLRALAGPRGALALVAGLLVLLLTRWVVGAAGVALLTLAWGSLGGAAGERRSIARLEALATWTESLRDTIAGAVGLEQAIPASLRAAAPSLREPLTRLVDRLHTRMPMPGALRRFAADLDDPGADLIIAALIINARLRGPGLRDLLGALSESVREELDMRRKVNAERRSTRRSAQIVVGVSVGLALALALFNRSYVHAYDSTVGQLVLVVVVALYAAGFIWMRRLATFDTPERLLTGEEPGLAEAAVPAGGAQAGSAPAGGAPAVPGRAGSLS
jgi:Flp pilus assembly protein TadB